MELSYTECMMLIEAQLASGIATPERIIELAEQAKAARDREMKPKPKAVA